MTLLIQLQRLHTHSHMECVCVCVCGVRQSCEMEAEGRPSDAELQPAERVVSVQSVLTR